MLKDAGTVLGQLQQRAKNVQLPHNTKLTPVRNRISREDVAKINAAEFELGQVFGKMVQLGLVDSILKARVFDQDKFW